MRWPRPAGLSGIVTAATTSNPALTMASRLSTANSGVPKNTMFILRLSNCSKILILVVLWSGTVGGQAPAALPRAFHRGSSGRGAVTEISLPLTGCTNSMWRASREMEPSGFERLSPYFRSPFMGHPMADNCTRIWCLRPVRSSTSRRW